MLANSSDNLAAELKTVKAALNSTDIRWRGRLLLLSLNFLPLIHLLLMISLLLVPYVNWTTRVGIALAVLYLLPPLIARLVLILVTISQGHIAVGSKAFFGWWTLFQLQIVFCRLPALEEILRLIPGVYSLWLRLWGARIGRLTYWSPGTLITDRSFLHIGDDVVFGAGVRLNPHVLTKDKDGRIELLLATLKIGDRVIVGGYSLLTAGTEIFSDEITRARFLSPPFSILKDGKRTKQEQADEFEQH
jgi:acetyltransferase-like isoleucine patch superfamily enzyme